MPRDDLADCKACEQNLFGQYMFQINQLKRGMQETPQKKLAESDVVMMAWLDREIASLADAFNRRNGNAYMNDFIGDKDLNAGRLVKAFASK